MIYTLFRSRTFWEVVAVVVLLASANSLVHRARVAEREATEARMTVKTSAIELKMADREASIRFLVKASEQRDALIQSQQTRIDELIASRPSLPEIQKHVVEQTKTDPALVDSGLSIAGVHVRLASDCK